MTTEKAPKKRKSFKSKKEADDVVLAKLKKLIDKKFPKRLYELKIGSDDGGRMIEIITEEGKLSRAIRDFMPLNWEGWRTVVINRYAVSGAE